MLATHMAGLVASRIAARIKPDFAGSALDKLCT